MDNVNLIVSAFIGATISLSVNEGVKWYKDQRKWQKKRMVLLNYFINILKPGLNRYYSDLEQAIVEIQSYPPHTNILEPPIYDVLPWLNSEFLKSQELTELLDITMNSEVHADFMKIPGVINYLKDYPPSDSVSNFHDNCNAHYEDENLKGHNCYTHARGCQVVAGFKRNAIKNISNKKQPLNVTLEWVDATIIHLENLVKKKRLFARSILNK